MGNGKLNSTGEFFKRRDEWRKHPMLSNNLRNATPGLGIALAAFGVYLFVDGMYTRFYKSKVTSSLLPFLFRPLLSFSLSHISLLSQGD
ncbi:hypothetical protein SUGI_0948620 [Cryptomeria japonica]|nr:hypothetical protein SUGI_0948620 [Cryptomeria japonica]